MTAWRLQMGLLSFAVLCSAALVNIFYLQPVSRGIRVEIGPSPEAAPRAGLPVRGEPQGAVPQGEPGPSAEVLRAVQRELGSRGYVIGAGEGSANLVTRAAIMAYEFDHGLPLTAEATEALLRTIVLGPASAELPAAATGKVGPQAEQVIRTTQQSLAGLNYGPIKVDGFMGDATVSAIRRFERDQQMPETGRISGELVAKVAKLAALGQVQIKR